MRIYKRETNAPLPPIPEAKPQEQQVNVRTIEIGTVPQQQRPLARRFIDPCDLLFKPFIGEFLGTLLLDFFAAQLLVFVNENFMLTALCTGLLRYVLMHIFADCCSGEFNPALSIGKLFCLERSLFLSIVLIGSQFFGAFIGEVLFAAVKPATAQVFPFAIFNESEAFIDRLPTSFQSYFLIELFTTSLFVVTYLRTEHPSCMAAVTMISMTLAFNAGLETRATGNFAQILSRSLVGTLWNSPVSPWRYVEAAVAASFIAPFISAVLYWLLRSAKDMQQSEEGEVESNR